MTHPSKRIVVLTIEVTEAVDLPGRGERLEAGCYELRLAVERNEADEREVVVAGDLANADHARYMPLLQEDVDALARNTRVRTKG